MSHFALHLQNLVASVEESSERERRAIDEWTQLKSAGADASDTDERTESDEELDTVLDAFNDLKIATSSSQSSILSRILSKPNLQPLLPSLLSIISSSQPNETISEELVEMLGFEEIDLAMEVLDNRQEVTKELSRHISEDSHPVHNEVAKRNNEGTKPKADPTSLDAHAARQRMEDALRENASRPLYTGVIQDAPEQLSHVYTSASLAQGNILSHLGSRFVLPVGTTRYDDDEREEVTVPPARPVPPRATERSVLVSELDDLARGSFPGYTSLNRIQSIVYPTAYQSNENMLVCAPTGAGKTDVAMLTVLRVLNQHRSSAPTTQSLASTIKHDEFKIIYVAPMKALAAEIVRKLGKRLKWLSIRVRELTGDMQLTRAEIAETQIIVTTPEKWDVVTRKPTGEGELASKVKLLIIDEIHLLNDDRGAVIETIIARTLRQVESSQSVIRIVGLSATLPNYVDVADFLSVNRHTGLFYFDSSFRPIPLEQHFIGVKGKQRPQFQKNLDRVTFEKVSELVRDGHQVMVFVHSRKETVKAAMALKEAATADGSIDEFSCMDHPQYDFFRRDIGKSRNKEMKELFDSGFGIHHAGMLREDRNLMERLFDARAIKVLCCTATLAWGVNLPAHAVIIKGTQVYDSAKGSFVDLSVLDVLQVFGRAGRPGLEDSGVGYICTPHEKLDHYLDAVTSQNPIESRFISGMVDALNAEIALGTVANVQDAIQWLGYTYLFVRMRKNPFQYGLTWDDVKADPNLDNKRRLLIQEAAKQLNDDRMIAFDRQTGSLTITDLGRIAAKYYIRYKSIETFNKLMRPKMSEADVLVMICKSSEFEQIQVRENELPELERFLEEAPCEVEGGVDTTAGKVNVLLQGHISDYRPEDFALVSDQSYAAQNGGRIARALLEIAISKKFASTSAVLMGMSKAIEKRMWPFDQPLKQFPLKIDVLHSINRFAEDYTPSDFAAMNADDLGKLIHMNSIHGAAIRTAAKKFPAAHISFELRPLGPDVLKIVVYIRPTFTWDTKLHGSVEPFWLWIEDYESTTIYQLSHIIFRPTTDVLNVNFVIAIPNGKPPPSVMIRFVSDRWIGAEEEIPISFDGLVMPSSTNCHRPRIDVPFLPLDVLQDQLLQDMFAQKFAMLNALQSQIFWSMAYTRLHSLVCAPTGCGKSAIGQLVIWKTLTQAGMWALLVTPQRSILSEALSELRPMSQVTGVKIEILNENSSLSSPSATTIRLVTASVLLSILSKTPQQKSNALKGLRLVVCENLELLDAQYELAISILLHATQQYPTRYIGLSSSLNDPSDLAAWLGVEPSALYSFRPSDRDQYLTMSTHTFTIPQSAALFKAMAKPAHAAIQSTRGEPAIVFVPSRAQCQPIALDLITQCALEMQTASGYLSEGVSPDALDVYLTRLRDRSLVDFVTRGVGFFYRGLTKEDRTLLLEMYVEGIIRVLIVPRDSCWSLPVRAATVIVMGTQYMHVSGHDGEERQLRDYGLEELVRMQGRAVRQNGGGHFHLFCQLEAKDTFMRFLTDGLPLESRLLETDELKTWYHRTRTAGAIRQKQDGVDALSFTFLARRLESNPTYYDVSPQLSADEMLSRVVDDLESLS